ncbi:MAG: hypothetical protein GX824_04105 [Clostridiales bacterium]|nr:hypothetical protein [Clostridiales bacterium]
MAQGEPKAGEVTVEKEGKLFSVEKEISDAIDGIEIDYYDGWLRRGFRINVNGSKSSC